MRKWCLFLSLYMVVCLLAACGAGAGGPVKGGVTDGAVSGSAVSGEPAGAAQSEAEQAAAAVITCRVVSCQGESVLLAEAEGSGVFTLSLKDLPLTKDGRPWADGDSVQGGDLVDIGYSGVILETWPGQLQGAAWADVRSDGRDSLCALYLQVLEDLWAVDSGLNNEITMVGVDLSATSLTDSERAAVAWAFAAAHGKELVEGTWQELGERGYIDTENLLWKDGCHFSITEKEMEGIYSLRTVAFDAQKWRSGLGAYYFADCTSVQAQNGLWQGYNIGAEAIS